MPPDQFGLLPSRLAFRARFLIGRMRIRVLGDSQPLELNGNVFGRAALSQGLTAVLIFITQNVTLFDETVCEVGQARGWVPARVPPAPSRAAAAALGAAA